MKCPRSHYLRPGAFDVSHETFVGVSPLCVLLNLEALLQLTTGRVDVVAAGIADRGLDAAGLKTTLKVFDLMNRRRLERAALDIVKLNQIDMAQRTLAEVTKCLHLGVRVVDAVNHGVLIGRAATGFLGVELKGLVKAEQRVLLNARHDFVARRLDSRVQRDGEGELLGDVSELADTRDNAAGRDREVTCADADAVGIVEYAQRLEDFVVVGEGLALAHEDDAGGALTKIVGDMQHLVDDLLGTQRTLEAVQAGGAKGAAHAAACLGGDADGKLVATGHADGLDRNAIVVLEQVFAGSVLGDLLGELRRRVKGKSLFKLLAEGLREVRHIVKRTDVLFKNPLDKLFGAERGLAELGDELTDIALAQVANVLRFSPGIHGSLSILGKRRGYRYNMVSAAEIIEEESAHAG